MGASSMVGSYRVASLNAIPVAGDDLLGPALIKRHLGPPAAIETRANQRREAKQGDEVEK